MKMILVRDIGLFTRGPGNEGRTTRFVNPRLKVGMEYCCSTEEWDNKWPLRVIHGFKENLLESQRGVYVLRLDIVVAYWIETGIVLHLSLFIIG